ncbi:MAG: PAS domain-containing sensor histidine kinase [Phyllobacterium sp.]
MTLRGGAWKTYLLTGTAMLAFVIFLTFALIRLVQIEHELKSTFGESLLHALMNAQYQGALLVMGARRIDAEPRTEESVARVKLLYDLLLSRMTLLGEGPMARQVAALGFAPQFSKQTKAVRDIEPWFDAALAKGEPIGDRLEQTMQPLLDEIRDAAIEFVFNERQTMGGRRDRYQRSLFEIIVSVIGILACGCVLSLRLLQELRRSETTKHQLQHELEFSALVLNASTEGIAAFDQDMRLTHWNEGMAKLFGVERENVIGLKVFEKFDFPDNHPVREMVLAALQGKRTYQSDHYLPQAERYVEKEAFPILEDGAVVGGIVFIRDVTDRYQAHRKLEEDRDALERLVKVRTADLRLKELQLRTAINTAPDGFAAFDASDRLVVANPRAREFFPDKPELFEPGTPLQSLLAGGELPLQLPEKRVEAVENIQTGEMQLPSGDWLLVTLRRSVEAGSVMRFADVTSYKESAMALQTALEREQNLRELYRGFVSMVSHQFRTPLAIIDSSAQRMMRRGNDMDIEEISTRTEKIRLAAMRLAKLVDSTLTAARLDSGRIDFNPRPSDFAKLIQDACERQRELTPERIFDITIDGFPARVNCDPLLMDQVIANLVSNAAKYSPDNLPIQIRASEDDDMVEMTVQDYGIGVPADEIPRLFERFFRARTAAGIEGTGIGLHLAREIARMHGGDITVESTEAIGTTFTLSLPLNQRHSRNRSVLR